MPYKVAFWITCLLLVSTGAMAAPRASIRDGCQTGIVTKEIGSLASGAYFAIDATESRRIATPFQIGLGSPATDNETNVTGAYRFEAAGKPRSRARDSLVPAFSQDHAASSGGFTGSNNEFGIDNGLRKDASPVARHIPTTIRLRLAQPAAPPVNCKQTQALRLA